MSARPSPIRNRARLLAEVAGPARALRADALDRVEAALAAVDPERCTATLVGRWQAAGWPREPVTILAFGKAAAGMARAGLQLPVRGGVVIGRDLPDLDPLECFEGGHPLPCDEADRHAGRVEAWARGDGPVVLLVSGGGSSMLCAPKPGVSVGDLRQRWTDAMHAGWDIARLNALRVAHDRLKGGGLARLLAGRDVRCAVLSDVPGHPPELVASGPHAGLPAQVAADWSTAVLAAGGQPGEPLRGEARELGERLAGGPACVAGGETTVTVLGSGRGGRNQEVALGAHRSLDDGLVLALGTDGVDGSSDAAGALLDGAVLARAAQLGLDPEDHLRRNDSHAFFAAAGGRIETGPTGTNVADLYLRLR